MIDLVVAGTIGLDDIETPFGRVHHVIGGSAIYASIAASFFAKPGIISIAGVDLPESNYHLLRSRSIDISGVAIDEKTFRWSSLYEFDMNEAKTLKTKLNCVTKFNPKLPESYKGAKFLFLANINPVIQKQVLDQMEEKPFVLLDTMNYWIENKKSALTKIIKRCDLLLLNDSEARQLFDSPNLVKAARLALQLGPKYVVIKKGEHGALLFSKDAHFSAPGYPLENTMDPTGAGDSFAGALAGYLAKVCKTDELSLRRGIVFASAIASFCAEDFSTRRLLKLKYGEIEERYEIFKKIREF
ncbi:sugar kinase [Candidatus Berkelbacteria bacterium CG10_big_fil_rev_8_21_14_0_10_41_12]|uniref:Sugar kinase n=1 Tax=Candidatus Berkelbacteria bacterium CG10_big_fil_rev_8_21_14_0_10_41_12 TaxID=1974513 RepID=A0A2M6WWK3_9BACT|nr:MAG: sugar kinase [Candidatus Berkelbacteria bacterium CG10_big_fil_rev_8_21_14_0_10_41_12]